VDVSEFHVRKIVRRLQLDLEIDNGFLAKIPWLCTQCSRCRELCDQNLDLPDMIMALRQVAIEQGLVPEAAGKVSNAIRETGSPYKSLTRTKSSWINDSVNITPDAETLCWIGCTPSIMSQNIARATASVADKLGGGFRVLTEEPCCGEPLLSLGLMDEATEAAERAVEALRSATASGVTKIVTSCAGCFNTFTNSYPKELGVEVTGAEIMHLSQYLGQLSDKKLELKEPLTVTYHDPCSLGRNCGVYDAPRELLKSIEGLTLTEMNPSREQTMCCGGGGGVWSVNRNMAMEIASKKLERSTLGFETDAVVTSCPMCYNNFRYTVKRNKLPLRVYELSEIVAMALE
jgi:Fe-S oxidoreductase